MQSILNKVYSHVQARKVAKLTILDLEKQKKAAKHEQIPLMEKVVKDGRVLIDLTAANPDLAIHEQFTALDIKQNALDKQLKEMKPAAEKRIIGSKVIMQRGNQLGLEAEWKPCERGARIGQGKNKDGIEESIFAHEGERIFTTEQVGFINDTGPFAANQAEEHFVFDGLVSIELDGGVGVYQLR